MSMLVVCTQAPYNGGAATNSYALIKHFRSMGVRCAGLFICRRTANVDPDNIGGVFVATYDKLSYPTASSNILSYLGEYPKLSLCKNYVAPSITKRIFDKSKIIYLIAGSPMMIQLSRRGISARKYLNRSIADFDLGKSFSGFCHNSEIEAINNSNYLIFNSKISRDVFYKTYKKHLSNQIDLGIVNTSDIINSNYPGWTRPIISRPIDGIFVSSRLTREVKNFNLFLNIANLNKGMKFLAVGDDFERFQRTVSNVSFVGKVSNERVIGFLKKSKVSVNTSYFDASPNVISESIINGCNILTSRNCGWSETYPKVSVC